MTASRGVGARLRRAVHVALKIVAAVLAGEEQIADRQSFRAGDRRPLARLVAGVAALGPREGRPVEPARPCRCARPSRPDRRARCPASIAPPRPRPFPGRRRARACRLSTASSRRPCPAAASCSPTRAETSRRCRSRRSIPASPTAGCGSRRAPWRSRRTPSSRIAFCLQRRHLDVHLDVAKDRERHRQDDDVGVLVDRPCPPPGTSA